MVVIGMPIVHVRVAKGIASLIIKGGGGTETHSAAELLLAQR